MDTKDIEAIRERLRRTMEYEEWRCSGRQVERDQRTLDREALLQHVDELREALTEAVASLHEATAILGGEYGDNYAVLCNHMLKLEEMCSRLTLPAQPTPTPRR